MKTLDADAIVARVTPVPHQEAHEIQPLIFDFRARRFGQGDRHVVG